MAGHASTRVLAEVLLSVAMLIRESAGGQDPDSPPPGVEHARACLPCLHTELGAVRPTLLVTLGATAARALLGTLCHLTQHRREVLRYVGLALVVAIILLLCCAV
jgi:uracil-DNA glycosylase family 4